MKDQGGEVQAKAVMTRLIYAGSSAIDPWAVKCPRLVSGSVAGTSVRAIRRHSNPDICVVEQIDGAQCKPDLAHDLLGIGTQFDNPACFSKQRLEVVGGSSEPAKRQQQRVAQ